MKIKFNLWTFLGLLLACQQCLAQSGYNYARPEVTNIAATAAGGRPIVGPAFPTGGPTAAATFSTAATTAYGGAAPGTGGLNPTTAAAYGGYGGQGQPQRIGGTTATGFTPSVPGLTSPSAVAAAFTGGSTAGLPKQRPTSTLTQRPGGSIYAGPGAANIGGTQPTQFSNTARGGAGGIGGGGGGGIGRGQSRGDLGGADYDDEAGDYSAIPGVPNVDYPTYAQVPPTNFDCLQQLPGYYSDVEAQCQVFHICAMNRTYSFLCPNGTVFSQETLVCVWWNQFDCVTAPSLYGNNAYIYDYGNERASTQQNAFQNAQIGIGGGTTRQQQQQQQPGYAQTPTGTRTTASTVAATSIYGGGNIRGTVGGSNFPNPATSVTPVPGSNFQNTVAGNTITGRFMPSTTATAQAFNPAAGVATPAPFGSVIRGGVAGSVGAGGGGGGGTQYTPSGQIASTSSNREYLPPRRP